MLDRICKNKKASLQQLYGRRCVTRTLCNETNSNTKIVINPNIAIQNLQNLKNGIKKNPNRLKTLKFLYTDICNALGIEGLSSSHYGGFNIDGFECSIRVSNHNSNANSYEFDLNNNISIKIRPRTSPNRFIPSNTVTLEEFVYYDHMLARDSQLVLDIIDSLIGYLSTGEYIDESGLAKKNYSPDLQTISRQRVQQTLQRKDNEDFINRWHMGENKNYNINNTMKNKKVIRLTESDLHLMIEEAVREVLKETSLYYDEDNFSGRHTLTQPHPYIDDEGYLDNPNNYDDMNQSENEYSWDLFDNKPIATGVGGYYEVSKKAIPSEINTAIERRKHMKNWDEKELKNRERMMKKWVKGKRNINDIEDTWADIH